MSSVLQQMLAGPEALAIFVGVGEVLRSSSCKDLWCCNEQLPMLHVFLLLQLCIR